MSTYRRTLRRSLTIAVLGSLVLAPAALADSRVDSIGFAGKLGQEMSLNSVWVMLAAILCAEPAAATVLRRLVRRAEPA